MPKTRPTYSPEFRCTRQRMGGELAAARRSIGYFSARISANTAHAVSIASRTNGAPT
jgi:hypothetical protein